MSGFDLISETTNGKYYFFSDIPSRSYAGDSELVYLENASTFSSRFVLNFWQSIVSYWTVRSAILNTDKTVCGFWRLPKYTRRCNVVSEIKENKSGKMMEMVIFCCV